MTSYKHNPGINARIEWLGQMNDRRIAALARNDEVELEKIAHEYETRQPHGLPVMAREIRLAIKLRREVQGTK